MRVLFTGGQAGDNPQILPLLDGISVARPGPGRPRMRPEVVIADKGYSHPSTGRFAATAGPVRQSRARPRRTNHRRDHPVVAVNYRTDARACSNAGGSSGWE
ncbi:hypothetical protein [Nocardia araoensis]|uniref:hypothetical protein n=1 Tax=Nocardia araoensis TaxID=228600 RepID=UPI0012F6BDB9|nr:hypothetical protein [Nocardia araoensis]